MQSTPKIMVLQLKEVIYTIIFVILAVLLVLLFIFMFLPDKKENERTSETSYQSGTYTASLVLNSMPLEVSVCVEDNYIKSVDFTNLDESVSVMYPLLQPSLDHIENFVVANQSLDEISYEKDNSYTSAILEAAVKSALEKAEK